MKPVKTYHANIYVGLREGYGGQYHYLSEIERVCAAYCDHIGLCVTVTPTMFVYRNGREAGAIVGLINYPRFPKEPHEIRTHAMILATQLRDRLGQLRVTVELTDETVMIGEG